MAPNPPYITNEIPGSAKLNGGVYVYARAASTLDIVSSVTETSIFSQSIAAGHMGSDRMLRLTVIGDYLQNTAGSATLRVKFGGTVLYAGTVGSISVDVNRLPMLLTVTLANIGVANSQYMSGELTLGNNTAPPTTGIGVAGGPASSFPRQYGLIGTSGLSTLDTAAAAQTFDVTWQWGTSSASLSFRRRHAILELIG